MLSESYVVELLKKLPLYHRNIYEFQQIAGAQEPELQALLIAVDAVLDNWFVYTANEEGISRLERIAGIVPDRSLDLETRRYKLLTKMTEKIPYTDKTLEERLGAMAGEDNYSIVRDYLNYKIQVNTTVTARGSFDEICNALVKMIPCNLILEVLNTLEEGNTTPFSVAVVSCVAMRYQITNDIKSAVNQSSDLNVAQALSTGGSSGAITMDIAVKDEVQSPHYEGVGVGMAFTKIVTHDINSKATNSGNTTVASPVNTATVITIN